MVAKRDSEPGNGAGPLGRAADAYQAARDRTYSAYETARDRAADVTRQASRPDRGLSGRGGGRRARDRRPARRSCCRRPGARPTCSARPGKKITDAARDAAQRGLEAGKEQIDELRSKAAKTVGDAVVEVVGGSKD